MKQYKYIYQYNQWPDFFWDKEKILSLLAKVQFTKGLLFGKMSTIGLSLQETANLDTITQDIIKSSEIEGEILNLKEVRSSVAKRLGINIEEPVTAKRNIDSIVEMMFDAIHNYNSELTTNRLFAWHNSLFPNGYSGLIKIKTAAFRTEESGPMQVVSGAIGRETIHYEAPSAEKLEMEMKRFLNWFNHDISQNIIIKSAIAHLWFVTLHPFEDGNGRIARTITDMLLAKSDNSSKRFYSMSYQIQQTKNSYYDILEKTQKGSLDITDWLEWFLNCLLSAVKNSDILLSKILQKHAFLQKCSEHKLNARQLLMINMLFDNFKGNLTSSKWAKICKCSQDTAGRDIDYLLENKILKKIGAGRSTHYEIYS